MGRSRKETKLKGMDKGRMELETVTMLGTQWDLHLMGATKEGDEKN